MQQVQRDPKQLYEVEWEEKHFNFKKCLSSSKINENMKPSIDSSQEELIQVDNIKEIPWIQQKSEEVFIKHRRRFEIMLGMCAK